MNKTKNMLFSIISHDLRNPFAALLNIAEVLASNFEKMEKNTLQKSISLILNSANRIYRLLENLLL
jgi:K+-sensing histidine kinase KdpD